MSRKGNGMGHWALFRAGGGVPMQKGVGRGGTWRGWTLPLGTFGLGENALEWTTYH